MWHLSKSLNYHLLVVKSTNHGAITVTWGWTGTCLSQIQGVGNKPNSQASSLLSFFKVKRILKTTGGSLAAFLFLETDHKEVGLEPPGSPKLPFSYKTLVTQQECAKHCWELAILGAGHQVFPLTLLLS